MDVRQAAAFAAVERTGLTKSDIGRIAGVHRSQVSRWTSGEQRPSYERTMRLADYLRRNKHHDLAEQLVAAAGYGPVGQGPESAVPPDVVALIRRRYPDPEQQRRAIEALEDVGEPTGPPGAAQSAPEAGRAG